MRTGSLAVRIGNDNNASALGLIFGFRTKFVCILGQLGKRFGWPERVHGNRSGGINSPSSFKTWFAQLEASVRRATSAKCGEMAHAPTEVSPRHLENSLGDCFKQYHRVEQQFKPFRCHRTVNSP